MKSSRAILRNFRALEIARATIRKLGVNLKGLTILTEVGSNNYLFTPIIASLAGADKVYAWVKDSSYGSAYDIERECLEIANSIGVSNIVVRKNEFPESDVANADVITNSGALRPLNKSLLDNAKASCVIPLMYEAWELRDQDLDINFCREKGIKVAGTWENHPDLKVFEYAGVLAVKFSLEAGFEVFGNTILIWSDDHFGVVAEQYYSKFGARKVILTTDIQVFNEHLEELDFVYICDYDETREYFGVNGIFNLEEVRIKNFKLTFIHLFGQISSKDASDKDIELFPKKDGKALVMSETLGYVGLEPIMKLQVAGFKVAEELKNNSFSTLSQLIT